MTRNCIDKNCALICHLLPFFHRVFIYCTSAYQRCCYAQHGEGSSHQGEVLKQCTPTDIINIILFACCVTFAHFPPQDFPWIVADEQEVHMQEPRLIPLKTMTSDIVKVSGNILLTDHLSVQRQKRRHQNQIDVQLSNCISLRCHVMVNFPHLRFLIPGRSLSNRCSSTWKNEPRKRRSSLCRVLLLQEPFCDNVETLLQLE